MSIEQARQLFNEITTPEVREPPKIVKTFKRKLIPGKK